MRALMATVGTLIFAAGFGAGGQWQAPVGAQGFTVALDCGATSASQLRTTLDSRAHMAEGFRERARVADVPGATRSRRDFPRA